MIKLIEIDKKNKNHKEILFDILNKRSFNISHKKEISYDEHSIFVSNHPYRKWFLISEGKKFIGTIYLTFENEIGINLIEKNHMAAKKALKLLFKMFKPLPPIPSIRNENFLINISPKNKFIKEILKEIEAILIQETYSIVDSDKQI